MNITEMAFIQYHLLAVYVYSAWFLYTSCKNFVLGEIFVIN
jgi:hypothetical protein